jgi:hypothetical protein
MKREVIEESYIYFAKRFSEHTFAYWRTMWLNLGLSEDEVDSLIRDKREVKIGETASYATRSHNLHYYDKIDIVLRVKFMGTKEERMFVESYVRSRYSINRNMIHHGNDYFTCANSNTIKGAERKFFDYVTEGFAMLSSIKGKKYEYAYEVV